MIADLLSAPKLSEPILFRETKYFTIKPMNSSGIFEYIIKPDTILTDLVAREAKRAIEELMPEKKVYLLVSSDGFFRVHKKGKKAWSCQTFFWASRCSGLLHFKYQPGITRGTVQ
jgi:hypothetical protein